MNNQQFLKTITLSFIKFLETHSRSNEKLKILHRAIAHDLSNRLGENYKIKSLGYDEQNESKIQGRYINKNVDITILSNNQPIAGIGVKFVMQNYAQANNYFENMLGETANIRSNNIPYFQIFIIPSQLPYYKNTGEFSKWEYFNENHFKKYQILSYDNNEYWLHSPNKTLIYIIDLPIIQAFNLHNKNDYINHYLKLHSAQNLIIKNSTKFDHTSLGSNVILNDYEAFMKKTVYRILSE
ncbi:MAG: hypothetical protein Q3971_04495 [Moraxella sp.]|nr:hypothetical protein [Moraxella sp.]